MSTPDSGHRHALCGHPCQCAQAGEPNCVVDAVIALPSSALRRVLYKNRWPDTTDEELRANFPDSLDLWAASNAPVQHSGGSK